MPASVAAEPIFIVRHGLEHYVPPPTTSEKTPIMSSPSVGSKAPKILPKPQRASQVVPQKSSAHELEGERSHFSESGEQAGEPEHTVSQPSLHEGKDAPELHALLHMSVNRPRDRPEEFDELDDLPPPEEDSDVDEPPPPPELSESGTKVDVAMQGYFRDISSVVFHSV
jgi:hypothetical protein